MAKIGVGKIMLVGGSVAVRLPKVIVNDNAFWLKEGMEVVTKLEGNKLIIEKA